MTLQTLFCCTEVLIRIEAESESVWRHWRLFMKATTRLLFSHSRGECDIWLSHSIQPTYYWWCRKLANLTNLTIIVYRVVIVYEIETTFGTWIRIRSSSDSRDISSWMPLGDDSGIAELVGIIRTVTQSPQPVSTVQSLVIGSQVYRDRTSTSVNNALLLRCLKATATTVLVYGSYLPIRRDWCS